MIKLIVLVSSLLAISCSSVKIKERELEERDNSDSIKRDYKVRDASSDTRPGWIEDAELYAKQAGLDNKKYRYFSYETTAKVDRSMACAIAKAQANSEIASEITTFIQDSLSSYKEGEATIDLNNPETKAMKEFVERSLTQKTKAMVHGAAIYKKYWEKRAYIKDLGAKKDFIGHTCSVYLRIPSDQLKTLVKRAAQKVIEKSGESDQNELKSKVEKALKDADENFEKARQV